MFVIGVDPGLSRCGYCVLDAGTHKPVALGVLTTPPSEPTPTRLAAILLDIRSLFSDYPPAAVALERVLFQVNVSTAMGVGQASGIIMAEAAVRGADVVEYSPNQVKQTVAGHGAADKAQMQEMVKRLLGLSQIPRPADAADAAAVALCHLAQSPAMVAHR